MDTTAAMLRRVREEAGLSLRELAARAGTSHSALVAYEAGRKTPRADTRDRILAAAGWHPVAPGTRRRSRTDVGADTTTELLDVLSLADHLPVQVLGALEMPPFPPRLGP